VRPYTEAQLQAYVERHLEDGLSQWCPSLQNVKLLGSQVRCETGIIDVLGVISNRPLVIELKAVTTTAKVVEQVMRYRNAVQDVFANLCLDIGWSIEQARWLHGEDGVQCVVIAPEFTPVALRSLAEFGWSLVARLDENGEFIIREAEQTKRASEYHQRSPALVRLLRPVAQYYTGTCLGMEWQHRWQEATKSAQEA
jgi:RecB family endonuclease NucS